MQRANLKNRKSQLRKPISSIGSDLAIEEGKVFQTMFICSDDESVEVLEGSFIDFSKVVEHLGKGHSIFITQRKKSQQPRKRIKNKKRNTKFIDHI